MSCTTFVAVAPAARLRWSAGAMTEFGAAHSAVTIGPELT